jgi:hypothetical protein
MTARWAAAPVRPEVWRVPAGSSTDYATEQDEAAGGHNRRLINLPGGGSAMASIRLKCLPNSRRVYAYLRYSLAGKTVTKYVGDATAPTRHEALRKGMDTGPQEEPHLV